MIEHDELQRFANTLFDKVDADPKFNHSPVYITFNNASTGHIIASFHWQGDVEMYSINPNDRTWMRHYGPWH